MSDSKHSWNTLPGIDKFYLDLVRLLRNPMPVFEAIKMQMGVEVDAKPYQVEYHIASDEELEQIGLALIDLANTGEIHYSEKEISAIIAHEKEHTTKAASLGYKTAGTVIITFYKQFDGQLKLTFSYDFDEKLEELDDMEVSICPEKPSRPDMVRFVQILKTLGLDKVNKDRLYILLERFCQLSGWETITDIDKIILKFQGRKRIAQEELVGYLDRKIYVEDKAYILLQISSDETYITIEDNLGDRKNVPLANIEILVDE